METILIISGEISGDVYAGELALTLSRKDPGVAIYGIGGACLKKQIPSENFIFETGHNHAMGEWENWTKRHDIHMLLEALSAFLTKHKIAKAVLIDYPYANFAISRVLQKFGVPIYTFITPNFWIWNDVKSARKIAAYSHSIIAIFEKEAELYRALHPRVYYFGHPLLSLRTVAKSVEKKDFITLFPGSRKQEIHYHFPAMLRAVQLLQRQGVDVPIQIAVINPVIEHMISEYLRVFPIRNYQFENALSPTLLSRTKILLCVAGTVTLEALITYTPMIVLGAVSPITYFLGKYLLRVKLPWISLPNIVMQKTVVPEFIQQLDAQKIAAEIAAFLSDENAGVFTQEYDEIIQKLIPTNPFMEIANLLLYSPK